MFKVKRKIEHPNFLDNQLPGYPGFEYLLNGKTHREDGAAIELDAGGRFYYLNNKMVFGDELKEYVQSKKNP